MERACRTIGIANLGLLNTVGIVFVVLKLLSVEPVARWSWLWVLSPFWIGIAASLFVLVLFVAAVLGAMLLVAVAGTR